MISKIPIICAVAFVLAFSYQGAHAGYSFDTFVIHSDGGGDCEDIGNWNQGTLTCELNDDIFADVIIIDSDNITLDGDGYTLNGFECLNSGITVSEQSGVRIKDITVTGYSNGIKFFETDDSTVINTNSNNNCDHGIFLDDSGGNTIEGSEFNHNEDDNIMLVNSDNNIFEDVDANNSDFDDGVDLENSDHNSFTNLVAFENDENGVDLEDGSNGNTFTNSELNTNDDDGISIEDSNDNVFFGGEIINNDDEAIRVQDSDNNRIALNIIEGNNEELDVQGESHGNTISCNQFIENRRGVEFDDSESGVVSGNIVTGNTFTMNEDEGILFDEGTDNDVFLNNFIDQASSIVGSVESNNVHDNFFENSGIVGTTVNNIVQCNEEGEVIIQETIPEQIPVPNTTVDGVDVFSGPSFSLDKDYGPEDFLCINATGTVDISSGQFTSNAAGVIVSPSTTNTGAHPGGITNGPGGVPFGSILIGNDDLGFVPFFTPANSGFNDQEIPGPTSLEEQRTMDSLFGTGSESGTPIEFRVNDSNTVDNSDQFQVSNCIVHESTKNHSTGNAWSTRPTFGVSHETNQQFVENGFSFNGNQFTITDNHHTPFAEQSVDIGTVNSFSATVYADKKLHVQEFLFGIPTVGESQLAELGVEVWYNINGKIEDVKVVQKSDVIDADSVRASHEKVKCLSTDLEANCDTTTVSMEFLEPLKDKVMAIKAIDFTKREQRTYLNKGFDISGESLNPMKSNMIPPVLKNEGLIKVTQVAKYSPYWVADDGRTFEMNSFGSFTQINQKFERIQDLADPKTRIHSDFGKIITYEQKRALKVFDSSDLISELPKSFAYIFPESNKRMNDEMKQEMHLQEEIAKGILDGMIKPTRYF